MDLFGNALRDVRAGRKGRMLTIHRDDGHTDTHDPALYFTPEPFSHEMPLLEEVEGPVLDVGCGAGRTLLWLGRQSVKATGIDLSPGAVAVSRARGCRDVRLGNVMDPDKECLEDASFRTAVLFGNNVGIGGDYEGAEVLLRRLATVVAPGGRLLVTGLDIASTDDPRHLAYHRQNRDRGRPRGEIVMRFEYQGKADDWVRWFHPEPDELARLATTTGWAVDWIESARGPFFSAILRNDR